MREFCTLTDLKKVFYEKNLIGIKGEETFLS